MLLILLLEGEYLFEALGIELGLLPTPLFSLAHHHIMLIVYVCYFHWYLNGCNPPICFPTAIRRLE